MALTPATIARADYSIAQTPSLGGEHEIYASLEPAGIIKSVRNLGGAVYEEEVFNAGGTFGGISALIVGPTGLTGAVTGIIEVPDWAINQSTRFPCGKAGEGSMPGTFGARGEILEEYELPDVVLTGGSRKYYKVAATGDARITVPSRVSKSISAGLISSKWTTPGRTEIGEMSITAKNLGMDDGLGKIGGQKCTILIRVMRESTLCIAHIFICDWTPKVELSAPDSDGESTLTGSGQFSRIAVIAAPGTPA